MLSPVLLLSRITGHQVRAPGGRTVGRLADLTVRLDGQDTEQLVARLVVKRADGSTCLIPWQSVANLHVGRVELRTDDVGDCAVKSLTSALDPDEILLVRDVLDTQIVDVVGQRLARVADVLLARRPDAALEPVGVEVGFAGVLRRLGFRRAGLGEDVVAWSDLHLTSDRGHAVQLSTPRAAVHRLDARSLAVLISRVDTDAATEILAVEDPVLAAAAVRTAHPSVGERLLRAMNPSRAARIVAAMPAEQARRWRNRLARRRKDRRFLRWRVWPRRRHLFRRTPQ